MTFIVLNNKVSNLVQGCAYGPFYPQWQGEQKLHFFAATRVET